MEVGCQLITLCAAAVNEKGVTYLGCWPYECYLEAKTLKHTI